MPVIGIAFTSMEASRNQKPVQGEIQVNTTPKIIGVKEMDASSLKEKALSMEFEFETTYGPGIGKVVLKGDVAFMGDDNKATMAAWQKDKKLPEDISVEVLNHLFRKCLVKAAQLADDLQLPPPMNVPVVQKQPAK